MSNNTAKTTQIKAVPFFARFLEEAAEPVPPAGTEGTETPPEEEPPFIWTFKWPSDLEDI